MPFATMTTNVVSTSISSLLPDIFNKLHFNSTLLMANIDFDES